MIRALPTKSLPTPTDQRQAAGVEFLRLVRDARAPELRPIAQWAEAEIRLPMDGGDFEGQPYRLHRLPWNRLLFREIADRWWTSIVTQGPTQSGKTLSCFALPLLYHLCEIRENVVLGLPDTGMGADKWKIDLKPIMQSSPRLQPLLPLHGPGSRGGDVKAGDTISFTHGRDLKLMTAGGTDESKGGFSSRILAVTEAKRFSQSSDLSVESSPINQLRGRLLSHKRLRRREYIEGTVGAQHELPWKLRGEDDDEHLISSRSRIVVPCPHCGDWITPGRDDLHGWQDAVSPDQAADNTYFACPLCEHPISESERVDVNQQCQLLHFGQSIEDGQVVGDRPPTRTLFFHYSQFNNLQLDADDIGSLEWQIAHKEPDDPDRDDLDKRACQQFWSIPWSPSEQTMINLVAGEIPAAANDELPRTRLPADTDAITMHIDVGMYALHWVNVAWQFEARTLHVPDYERIEVLPWRTKQEMDKKQRRRAAELMIVEKLNLIRRRCEMGWQTAGGAILQPQLVLVDSRWLPDVVIPWTIQAGPMFAPSIGQGTGQTVGNERYHHPANTTNMVRAIGDHYHIRVHHKHRCLYFVMDSDWWKSWAQRRFKIDRGEPGSVTLFTDAKQHATFQRHLMAEQVVRELHKTKGWIDRWANPHAKPNHYLDAYYGACVAGHFAGFSLLPPQPPPPQSPAEPPPHDGHAEQILMPDGRPYY